MSSWQDFFFDFVFHWPDIDFVQVIFLFCAVIQVVVGWLTLRQAYASGIKRESDAVGELRVRLKQRIEHGDWLLLKPERVQALAITLSEVHSSPAITDQTVAALGRNLSLEYEILRPKNLRKILRILADISSHFDTSTPRFMSIGATNRMLAYYLSGLAFSFLTIGCQLWAYKSGWIGLAWVISAGHVWVVFAAIRAKNFWNLSRTADGNFLIPSIPHKWLDASLYFAMDKTNSIHTSFAPIFEEVMFRIVPILILPAIVGFGFKLGRAVFNYTPSADIQTYTFYLFVAVIIYWQVWVFSSWHQYKCFQVRRLRNMLARAQRKYLVAFVTSEAEPAQDSVHLGQITQIAEKLWILTGNEFWRPDEVINRLRKSL